MIRNDENKKGTSFFESTLFMSIVVENLF